MTRNISQYNRAHRYHNGEYFSWNRKGKRITSRSAMAIMHDNLAGECNNIHTTTLDLKGISKRAYYKWDKVLYGSWKQEDKDVSKCLMNQEDVENIIKYKLICNDRN